MKTRILFLLSFIVFQAPVFAQTNESFNLAGVIESIINYQNKSEFLSDVREDAKENFLYAEKNLYNGNVVVAYSEFSKTIEMLDKNIALLMLAKKMYEYGFFSLGDVALSKTSNKSKMVKQIEGLKKAYKPFHSLTKEEENYLTKAYTSIYYNNTPEEVAFNLIKKTALMEASDYANYIMANSMFECRQYSQALRYIEKAIEKNPENSNYKYFKCKTLIAFKKYKEALKYIEENEKNISVYLAGDFKSLKLQVYYNLAPNDIDKKFYQTYSYYLSGNYYKVLKETGNILSFNKNNPKIITLQGMANLALGNYELAQNDFETSYKLDKKNSLTLMGLSDCSFINRNYKGAYEGYKKLMNTELKTEALIKAAIALEELNPNDKKLAKLNKQKQTVEESAFYEYYLVANNLFKDEASKKKYISKSLGINFLNPETWDVLFNVDYNSGNFDGINKISFILLFADNKDAKYYYYSALSLDAGNNKKEAFYEVKKAISLNPDYKPAIDLMNRLQNELI